MLEHRIDLKNKHQSWLELSKGAFPQVVKFSIYFNEMLDPWTYQHAEEQQWLPPEYQERFQIVHLAIYKKALKQPLSLEEEASLKAHEMDFNKEHHSWLQLSKDSYPKVVKHAINCGKMLDPWTYKHAMEQQWLTPEYQAKFQTVHLAIYKKALGLQLSPAEETSLKKHGINLDRKHHSWLQLSKDLYYAKIHKHNLEFYDALIKGLIIAKKMVSAADLKYACDNELITPEEYRDFLTFHKMATDCSLYVTRTIWNGQTKSFDALEAKFLKKHSLSADFFKTYKQDLIKHVKSAIDAKEDSYLLNFAYIASGIRDNLDAEYVKKMQQNIRDRITAKKMLNDFEYTYMYNEPKLEAEKAEYMKHSHNNWYIQTDHSLKAVYALGFPISDTAKAFLRAQGQNAYIYAEIDAFWRAEVETCIHFEDILSIKTYAFACIQGLLPAEYRQKFDAIYAALYKKALGMPLSTAEKASLKELRIDLNSGYPDSWLQWSKECYLEVVKHTLNAINCDKMLDPWTYKHAKQQQWLTPEYQAKFQIVHLAIYKKALKQPLSPEEETSLKEHGIDLKSKHADWLQLSKKYYPEVVQLAINCGEMLDPWTYQHADEQQWLTPKYHAKFQTVHLAIYKKALKQPLSLEEEASLKKHGIDLDSKHADWLQLSKEYYPKVVQHAINSGHILDIWVYQHAEEQQWLKPQYLERLKKYITLMAQSEYWMYEHAELREFIPANPLKYGKKSLEALKNVASEPISHKHQNPQHMDTYKAPSDSEDFPTPGTDANADTLPKD